MQKMFLHAERSTKKQEFGGAILEIKNSNCLLPVIIDQNSTYIQNKK